MTNVNIAQQLTVLFSRYIEGFHAYNMQTVMSCYYLPCALHTPDKIAYLANEEQFEQEFIDIFTVLKHASITKIEATKASYHCCDDRSVDVCIDWLFYDENNEVFTDFTAFYHLTLVSGVDSSDESAVESLDESAVDCAVKSEALKIQSVVSHELHNSVQLTHDLTDELTQV